MTSLSILFPSGSEDQTAAAVADPEYFSDLNLDQVVASVTAGREKYDLAPFFGIALDDVDDIAFRHEVMRDLQSARLSDIIRAFAGTMCTVREFLANARTLPYRSERERWFADAADLYSEAVSDLVDGLSRTPPTSRGLAQFCRFVTEYARSDRFRSLFDQARAIQADLTSIRYGLLIRGRRVEVRAPGEEQDFSTPTNCLFERFRQGDVEPYLFRFSRTEALSQVDSMILDLVSKRFPEVFSRLRAFCTEHQDFLDPTVARFDREIQFYVSWLEHMDRLEKAGLSFCYPDMQPDATEVWSIGAFDLALANKLVGESREIVCNDFQLTGTERILVVTGPNQGGKTTFARAFGQIHHVARLGLPVPGKEARLILCDRIFTHFDRRESIADLRGKLMDDLARMHDILEGATGRSIVIINETFSSTALEDAALLSRRIGRELIARGVVCVWVTFIDEVASLAGETVSMVATMAPDDPTERSYKIVRRPADGLAYARSIARKHRLTAEMIEDRLKP